MTSNKVEKDIIHPEWEELSLLLSFHMSSLREWHDGHIYEIKQLVLNEENFNVQIYSNDHLPPHFHIIHGEHEAVYLIDQSKPLTLLKGSIPSSIEKRLNYLYEMRFRDKLIKTWNSTRPSHLESQKFF